MAGDRVQGTELAPVARGRRFCLAASAAAAALFRSLRAIPPDRALVECALRDLLDAASVVAARCGMDDAGDAQRADLDALERLVRAGVGHDGAYPWASVVLAQKLRHVFASRGGRPLREEYYDGMQFDAVSSQGQARATIPLVLVLDNLRSAFNTGSIIRSADAVGAREVILCGSTPAPPNPKLHRTAMGATSVVPWRYFGDTREALATLRNEGYAPWAIETVTDAVSVLTMDPGFPLALVAGNEELGVGPDVLAACTGAVRLPQWGIKRSLNVAAAATTVMYFARKAWEERHA